MCISNFFCNTTQNWIELTGWEMYESYAAENYISLGLRENSNLLNSKMEEKQNANDNKKNAALEGHVLKE